jgi:hypothetical protein
MESQTVSGILCFTAGYREKLHRMRIAEFKSVSPGANQRRKDRVHEKHRRGAADQGKSTLAYGSFSHEIKNPITK